MNFLSRAVGKVFGSKAARDSKKLNPFVNAINEEFQKLQSISHDALRQKTTEFRQRIQEHLAGIDEDIQALRDELKASSDMTKKEALYAEIDKLREERNKHIEDILEVIMPEAFAVVKETARRFMENETLEVTALEEDKNLSIDRSYVSVSGEKATWLNQWTAAGGDITWNMLHYDVQLVGGVVLHQGKIAEMATGEGKTLVATLPAYLNALTGEGVHIITVNTYLSKRDQEWIGPIMEFLLLTVDCIDKYKPHSPERKKAYMCDITYGTNNEFGFDYLRDNMVRSPEERVQLRHHFAMIDEVDSVLIDDARTPLIISGPVPKNDEDQLYFSLKNKVEKLLQEQRRLVTGYLNDAKKKIAEGNLGSGEEEGGLALFRAFRGLPKYRALIKYLSEEGIKVTLQKTENFYMQEQSKNMHIADEPLYFTIEEKTNNVELTDKGAEFLSRGEEDPDFFIMTDIGTVMAEIENSDMDEEAKKSARQQKLSEFATKNQRLHALQQLLKAYTLFEKDDKYVVMDGKVKIVDEQTGRIMDGRRYSDGLHQALEAKENVKIEEATQTYATITLQNFFRMYHKLSGMTGTAETEAGEFWEIYKLDVVVIPTNKPIVRKDEEDFVFKTEREKFNAAIDEIVKLSESGRPVLVGTTSVENSEKLGRMLSMRKIPHNVLNAKQHQREAEIVAEAGQPGRVTIATNMAGRGTDIKISDEVKAAGGLAIVGTARHDSRRVDRQLRGRAGRQGDPGSSQFFVSLEDNLMRLFHSERIAKLMDRMGYKEGEVIQAKMVTKSIERAQKKVEENNFGIRKRLLEYDDVMNIQREAIYKRRNNALSGDRVSVDINNMFMDLTSTMVSAHKASEDYEGLRMDCIMNFGVEPSFGEEELKRVNTETLVATLQEQVMEAYERKGNEIKEALLPVVKQVHEHEGHRYKRISIPYSDGRPNPLPIAADLKEAVDSEGGSIMRDIEKALSLAIIDQSWKEHLRKMDELKESVQAASFEQKDPLVVYKIEAYNLFEEVINIMNRDVTSYLSRGQLQMRPEEENIREAKQVRTDYSKTSTNKSPEAAARAAAAAAGRGGQKQQTVRRSEKKIGRNDPCPCGSGKKYKQCHGKA